MQAAVMAVGARVVLARPPGSMALGRFANTLRFRVKEIDPSTGELG